MPNLARRVRSGTIAPLRSTPFPITPSAWAAAYTGLNPGRTGIAGFERPADGYSTRLVSARDLSSYPVHLRAARVGKRVCAIGFPLTAPAPAGAGIVVAGWDVPPGAHMCNEPEWERRLASFEYRPEDEFASDEKTLANAVRARVALADGMLREEHPHCLMLYLGFIDSLGHRLGYGNSLTGRLLEVADQAMGPMLLAAGEADVLACSDHGFGEFRRAFSLVQWLESEGYLTLRSRHLRSSATGGIPGIELMELDDGVIDWNETSAFCPDAVGPVAGIRLNTVDSYPCGTIGQQDVPALCDEIAVRLLAASDPVDGSKLVRAVWRREQLFSGSHLHELPELVVQTTDDTVAYVAKRRISDGGFELEDGYAHAGKFGGHRMDGIWASSFDAGVEPLAIADVGATLMGLLELDVSGLDGICRVPISTPKAANVEGTSSTTQEAPDGEQNAYTPEEEAMVRRRLEALGYL